MILEIMTDIASVITDYVLIVLLLGAALYFTVQTRFVQFTMLPEMIRLLLRSGKRENDSRNRETDGHHTISSFQAFMVSIASRVGTGNLAGVATAIAIGGPGAVFWMWVTALFGAASAFIESTLAQLFKEKGPKSFIGGPAYYILKGTGKRWWAVCFAVLIAVTFGLAFNSVQANTISEAFAESFSVPPMVTALTVALLTIAIIWGGIQSIARFSEWVVPIMAIAYIILAIWVIATNISTIPHIVKLIVEEAFGFEQALGGGLGTALVLGVKRGLFSNEAGEGSAPNVAATASVSHPVKQGLIQALGVFTDTLLICTCTAFIILCSGVYGGITSASADGIVLTQRALESETGVAGLGSAFVSIAVFFFAFTSIISNYYYGETNIRFISRRLSGYTVPLYRMAVGVMVFVGAISSLAPVWALADITMALMTICNLAALFVLGKYASICLDDYRFQRRKGHDPKFYSYTVPELQGLVSVWDDDTDSSNLKEQ